MRKVLLGVAIGISLSGVVLLGLVRTSEEAEIRLEADPGAEARLATSDIAAGESGINAQSVGANNRYTEDAIDSSTAAPDALDDDAAPDSLVLRESEAAREVRLRDEIEQAQNLVDQASAELQELVIERMLADNPVVMPSPLPPEFDWVAERRYRELFHERFQRELIDSEWSAPMEAELSRFIYERPSLVEQYGPPTIRCHTIRCEVLFSATGDGQGVEADARALMKDSLELMPEAFDCVQNNCWADANHQDGITTIFWGMARKIEQPRSLAANASE